MTSVDITVTMNRFRAVTHDGRTLRATDAHRRTERARCGCGGKCVRSIMRTKGVDQIDSPQLTGLAPGQNTITGNVTRAWV